MQSKLVTSSFLGLFSFCLCLFSSQPAISQVDRPIKDKWALVIGISKFKDSSIPSLQYAAKDAVDFRDFLVKEGNFQQDHILLLTDENATYENIRTAIGDDWLPRRVAKDDLVLVFVSSHGSPKEIDIGKDNFLITHDTRRKKLFATGLRFEDLAATIKDRTGCDRIVLIFDACNSGAAEAGGKGMYRAGNFNINSLVGEGQIVISSSDANQRSWESKRYKNGVFTHCLMNALKPVNGKQITIDEAFTKLKDKVEQEVRFDRLQEQTPVQKSKWKGKKLCLLAKPSQPRTLPKSANTIVVPSPVTDQGQVYLVDFKKLRKSLNVSSFDQKNRLKEDKLKALIAQNNKIYNQAKKDGQSKSELQVLRKKLQAEIDTSVGPYQKDLVKQENNLRAILDKALDQEAEERKVSKYAVLYKDQVHSKGIDITDAAIKRANQLIANQNGSLAKLNFSVSTSSKNYFLVDQKKLFDTFKDLKSSVAKVKEQEDELHKLIEESNKEYMAAKKQGRSSSYLNTMRKNLQSTIDRRFGAFQTNALRTENQLQEKLKKAFRLEAEARGVPLYMIQFTNFRANKGTDVTDSIIKRINSM